MYLTKKKKTDGKRVIFEWIFLTPQVYYRYKGRTGPCCILLFCIIILYILIRF